MKWQDIIKDNAPDGIERANRNIDRVCAMADELTEINARLERHLDRLATDLMNIEKDAGKAADLSESLWEAVNGYNQGSQK